MLVQWSINMSVKHLNDKDFDDVVKNSKVPVVVDFWAPWCRPCLMMAPVFEELSKEYDGKVLFVKLDVEKNQNVANKFAVQSIPSLLVFYGGAEIGRSIGFMPKDQLKSKIEEIINK